MGRNCTICANPAVGEINVALAGTRTPAGHIDAPPSAYRLVAKHFAVSPSAVARHMRFHLPQGGIAPGRKRHLREASAFLVAIEELYALTSGAIAKSIEIGDLHALARLIGAARGLIETNARLVGELRDAQPQVAIVLRWGDEGERGANAGQSVALPRALPAIDAVVKAATEVPES